MKNQVSIILLIFLLIISCNSATDNNDLSAIIKDSPFINGKSDYLNSPYVTAGDRVYMVGHQNGSFPDLGWHVKGEMGGIWDHPIKLMDGFEVTLDRPDQSLKLDAATSFVNYPYANKHTYNLSENNLQIERFQFVPDGKEGILIQYKLKSLTDKTQNFDFIFSGFSDLRPVWLGERTGMIDSEDEAEFLINSNAWLIKDSKNPWYVIFGTHMRPSEYSFEKSIHQGLGISGSLTYKISLQPNEIKIINFTIAGSYNSKKQALATYDSIQNKCADYLITKKQRYSQLAEQSKLTIPDKELQNAFEWLKYNCDWLIRDVPEIGRGITAGIPDYPWWFGVDSEYALQGYMAIGQTDIVYKTIHLLDSVSKAVNGNGRILHEMSTNGTVFNRGNINETPQFASLIWQTYLWNGDLQFLEKYFPTVKKGLNWLMSENDSNNNLFPDGFGMMEIHGLNSEMIDVAVYTQKAFADASKMAKELQEDSLASDYGKIARTLKDKINIDFWAEEFNSYADFIGTDKQALHLIDDAIIRADTLNKPWAIEELEETKKSILNNPSKELRPFVLHHNWVVNTPMEMKIAENEKAIKALQTSEKFVNPFGVFVTGIDRDASAGSDDGSFKGSKKFSYTGAVMTLPTGVQAIAENNYGRPDKALNYLKRMTRTFSYALPGSIYEVSPDYGMITQAWNIYSFAIPIIHQFFGIRPKASEKKVQIMPQMPEEWNSATLENVIIAENKISVFFEKKDKITTVRVTQSKNDWTLEIVLPKIENANYEIVKGNAEIIITENQIFYLSQDPIIEVKTASK
ncbi:glycogen debranching protein [uncultured Eudoraea sp.]|uniref:glycogen debranching protein n=1 Tax=uncultured Eudoraea sp. TaxID=1035614 RepID=UPI00262A5B54|nr:glycogen debranching protein [uncultured Eudoraea sp.]